jgi:hypothetical protein
MVDLLYCAAFAGLRVTWPDQPVRQREEHELGARIEVQLAHDVCAVPIDGPDRDKELLADLLVHVPEREQVENVALPVVGQHVRR